MSLRDALAHIAGGPVRGARQVNRARNNLGELLFPKQFDPSGNELNAGMMPFFGLPRPPASMALNPGTAGGTFMPKGMLKLDLPPEEPPPWLGRGRTYNSSSSSHRLQSGQKPILHLPDKQLTLMPRNETGNYVHADLHEAFSDYLRQAGIRHDLPKMRMGKSSLVDLWGMKQKPIEARWRSPEAFQSQAGVDIYDLNREQVPPHLLRDIHKELRQNRRRLESPRSVDPNPPKAVNWPSKDTLGPKRDPLRAARIAHKTMNAGTTARTLPKDLRQALVQDKVYKSSGRVQPVQKSTRATVQRGVEGAKRAVAVPTKERYRRSGR
jgi:hypothetical protein